MCVCKVQVSAKEYLTDLRSFPSAYKIYTHLGFVHVFFKLHGCESNPCSFPSNTVYLIIVIITTTVFSQETVQSMNNITTGSKKGQQPQEKISLHNH